MPTDDDVFDTFCVKFEEFEFEASRVSIRLRTYPRDEDGNRLLTPECRTPGELKWEIRRLHQELDEMEKRGCQCLARLRG